MKVTKVKILVSIKRFIQTGLGWGGLGGGRRGHHTKIMETTNIYVLLRSSSYFISAANGEQLPNIVKNYYPSFRYKIY